MSDETQNGSHLEFQSYITASRNEIPVTVGHFILHGMFSICLAEIDAFSFFTSTLD